MCEESDDRHRTLRSMDDQIDQMDYAHLYKLGSDENQSTLDALPCNKDEEDMKEMSSKYQKQNDEFKKYEAYTKGLEQCNIRLISSVEELIENLETMRANLNATLQMNQELELKKFDMEHAAETHGAMMANLKESEQILKNQIEKLSNELEKKELEFSKQQNDQNSLIKSLHDYIELKDTEFNRLEQQCSELKETYAKNKKCKAQLRDYSDCLGALCALVEADTWDQAMENLNALVISKCEMSQTLESLKALNFSLEKQVDLSNRSKAMELEQQKTDCKEKMTELEDRVQLYETCFDQFYESLLLTVHRSSAKQQPIKKTSDLDTNEQRLAKAQDITLKVVHKRNDALVLENLKLAKRLERELLQKEGEMVQKESRFKDVSQLLDVLNEQLQMEHNSILELMHKLSVSLEAIDGYDMFATDMTETLQPNEIAKVSPIGNLEQLHFLLDKFLQSFRTVQHKYDQVVQKNEKLKSYIIELEFKLEDYTSAKQSKYLEKIKILKCVNEMVKAENCRMKTMVEDLEESLSTAHVEKENMKTLEQRIAKESPTSRLNETTESLLITNQIVEMVIDDVHSNLRTDAEKLLLDLCSYVNESNSKTESDNDLATPNEEKRLEILEYQNEMKDLHLQLKDKKDIEKQFQECLLKHNNATFRMEELQQENQKKSILVNELQSKIEESEGRLEECLKNLQCQELVKDTMQREKDILQQELVQLKTEHTLLTDNFKNMQDAQEVSLKRHCKLENNRDAQDMLSEEHNEIFHDYEIFGLNRKSEQLKKVSCDQQNSLKNSKERILGLNEVEMTIEQNERLMKPDIMENHMKEDNIQMLDREIETLRSELDTEQQNNNERSRVEELVNKKVLDMKEQFPKNQNEIMERQKANDVNRMGSDDEMDEKLQQECAKSRRLKLDYQILQPMCHESENELRRIKEQLFEMDGNQIQLVRRLPDDDDNVASRSSSELVSLQSDAINGKKSNKRSFCKFSWSWAFLIVGFSIGCLLIGILVAGIHSNNRRGL